MRVKAVAVIASALLVLLAVDRVVNSQTFSTPARVITGGGLPGTCTIGDVYTSTSSGSLYTCTSSNNWTQLGGGEGESVPSGSILLIVTGACPTGYTEVSALNGKTLFGTLAGNGDIGGTGGSDTITPAGTNQALTFTGSSANTNSVSGGTPSGTNSAPSFTGDSFSSVINHTHTVNITDPGHVHAISTATTDGAVGRVDSSSQAQQATFNTNSATTGITATTSNPAGGVASITPTGKVSAPTFTGDALGTHQHSVTATGTINTPSFTGTQFDNRSAFVKVIFCQKD